MDTLGLPGGDTLPREKTSMGPACPGDGSPRSPASLKAAGTTGQTGGTFPVVGIGPSAGGIQAFGKLLDHLLGDNGIGVPPEHQERIFGIFERLHKQGGIPGTGIGLAIVRKAMERVGGRAGVDSQVGKGSRFWIELPKEEGPGTS